MKCQNCNINEATTHIKRTVNGNTKELDLCSDCAKNLGYLNFSFDFHTIWSGLFNEFQNTPKKELNPEKTCRGCNSTFSQIAESGKVGCAECYTSFYDELMPLVQQIHGNTAHKGKLPNGRPIKLVKESGIDRLKAELQEAIKAEEFEKAAKLRDKINSLKKDEE